MKIRIKGNALRLRLSKTDLRMLEENKTVTEKISFGVSELLYELKPTDAFNVLSASFEINKISILIPTSFSTVWNKNDIVSIDVQQNIGNNETLYILVEKDFQCLDKTTEDQTDYFINPNTTCK